VAAIGTTASNYEILSKLAEGGMAELFLARAVGQGGVHRHVVLKRIARERATDTQFVQMFLDEARLAAQLRHPNIAQVFDIGRLGVSYFFTMEYVHGVTVEDLIEAAAAHRSVLPIDAILAILFGTAAGLQHAHDRTGNDGRPLGIVHRDISPSNLMVTYDGHIKVVDFGVAKAQMVGRPETQAGEIKGKVGYLSPEQCRLQKLDRRSDLYSLGVVAWEMLTGKRLWKRETAFSTMAAIATEDVPLASEYRERLQPEVDAMVAKLLATEVTDRYQSAGDVIEAVQLVSATTRSDTSPSQLSRLMRELFGSPPEPWLVAHETVNVAAAPIPAELDRHHEDPSVDTVEHKLTSVFMAPEHEEGGTNTKLVSLPSERSWTASGELAIGRPETNDQTREVPSLARAPSVPSSRNLPRPGTELLPPEETEILNDRPGPIENPFPEAEATIVGQSMPVAPRHLPRAASTPSIPPPMFPLRRPIPSLDPTAPLGTQLPGTGPRAFEPPVPSSGPQEISNGPRLPRWPPPSHGDLGKLRWFILGGALLGIAAVVIVLVTRGGDEHRTVAPPADSVLIVAPPPDAAIDAAPVAIETAPAAIDAAEPDAASPDAAIEIEIEIEEPGRRKLRSKSELNAAFRERRYKDIVAACKELGADDDRAVVCTLAGCRARAPEAQDWYRNVPPKQRGGAINICKQSGQTIKDSCATDPSACRK